ncbi:MAG: oxidoreductase [Bacteroidetes bacterium]|nr:oxidoreductase [Bacteroidota bacterium]
MTAKTKTALLAGASGVTGAALLQLLLQHPDYHRVIVLVRKKLDLSHEKLEQRIVDYDNPEQLRIPCDEVFCCLGSTMAKAGSKEQFFKVDHDYVLTLARESKSAGARAMFVVSAVGADERSLFFYNRVKGEMERDLAALDFERLCIFRPGLLLGKREERRRGEAFAKAVYGIINPILPAAWKGIHPEQVAKAMIQAANQEISGKLHIVANREMV